MCFVFCCGFLVMILIILFGFWMLYNIEVGFFSILMRFVVVEKLCEGFVIILLCKIELLWFVLKLCFNIVFIKLFKVFV